MKEIVARVPDDARSRYFLAHELFKLEDWQGAAEQYEAYLRLQPDDEGVGYRNLGASLVELGRREEAARAYRRGIENALAHHHEGLADEIREMLQAVEG
jgi:tetratricopeptide (TPR) repeat protein